MNPQPWVDDPIQSRSADTLDRAHMARHAAQLIGGSHSWESSVVFGLTGAWGSGKSSMITLIGEELETSFPKWIIARFTPWATNDVPSLTKEFFACLAAALPPTGDAGEKLRKSLKVCATITSPLLKLIPYVGDAASVAVQHYGDTVDRPRPWDEAFRDASDQIKELQTPVLVIADDIDRLQADELVALLKVVRLLGRFPGVHFLLAYDEETLLTNLKNAGIGVEDSQRARLFMEKIVQYQLTVPPLLTNQLIVRLDAGLESIAADLERPWDASDSRFSGLLEVFYSQLTTPRSVERFLAQARHYLRMHDVGEINDVDLVLITFLHLQFPELYGALQRWKRSLTGGSLEFALHEGRTGPEINWDDLFAKTSAGRQREDARRVLESLFPAVKGKHLSGSVSGPRISIPEYFDRYFAHTIPTGDISNSALESALREAADPLSEATQLAALLRSTYPGQADLVLRRLRESTTTEQAALDLNAFVSLELVRKVVRILGDLGDGKQSLFSKQDQATYWAAHLLARVSNEHSAQEILDVVSVCSRKPLQMNLLSFALDEDSNEKNLVLREAAGMLAGRLSKELLEHLNLGDDAPEDSDALLGFIFVVHFGDTKSLRQAILQDLGKGFTHEDLAARFVSLGYLIAATPKARLGDFMNDVYVNFVADQPALDSENDSGEQLEEGSESNQEVLDVWDVSWQNRRKYVRRRMAGR